MSSTAELPYGDSITDVLRSSALFGTTADRLEELLAARSGTYWSLRDGDLYHIACLRVKHTGRDVRCSINFRTSHAETLPALLLMAGLTVLLCIGLLRLARRSVAEQIKVVDLLARSVEELENRVCRDERPEGADFQKVLRLTSDGLADSLTARLPGRCS